MSGSIIRELKLLWAALGMQLVGRLLDLRWHVTHDEFEGTRQQFEAHWLLWLGVLATLWAAAGGRRSDELGQRAIAVVLGAAVLYVAAGIWHFGEHAAGNDPQVAHVVLGVCQLAMYAGAAVLTSRYLRSRRLQPRSEH